MRAYGAWIDEAASLNDYLDDGEADDTVAGLEDVVEALEGLLEDGHADAVVELVEHAIAVAEPSMSYVEDSRGAYQAGPAEGRLPPPRPRLGSLHLGGDQV